MASQTLRRKWGWTGRTLRKPASNIAGQVLTWDPQGKRNKGRSRNTWRRDTGAGSDLESTGEEKEGKTQDHMAQRHRDRHAEKRPLLEGAGEDGPESGAPEDCR